MTQNLAELVVPVFEPLGFQRGWGRCTAERIRHDIPDDVGRLIMPYRDIDDVLTCGGLWQGRQTTTESPSSVYGLHRALVVRAANEYLEAALGGDAPTPCEWVHDFLDNESNFDVLTMTWLFLQNDFERTELRNELAISIVHLLEAWPQILDPSQVTLGPVLKDISLGDVLFPVDNIHVTFGDHRMGVEVNWPGAVLIRMVPIGPSPQDLEEMALGAVVHGIATGCPPQRLVVWGLQSQKGIGMDIERTWLEMAVAGMQLGPKAVSDIRNKRLIKVHGGEHCTRCPYSNSCDVSEADEYPF